MKNPTRHRLVLSAALGAVALGALALLLRQGSGEPKRTPEARRAVRPTSHGAGTPLRLEPASAAAIPAPRKEKLPATPPRERSFPRAWKAGTGVVEGLLDARRDVLKERGGIFGYNARTYGVTFDRGEIEFATTLRLKELGQPRMTYRLEEVRSGREVLARGGAVDPKALLEERAVSYGRGSIEERYIIGPDSIEQVFIVSSLPPERGTITVTGRVSTNLEAPEEGARGPKLAFHYKECELLSLSQAVAVDAAGRRQPLELAYASGRVTITVPADWVASAALPIMIDPLIGGPIQIDSRLTDFVDAVNGFAVRICDAAWNPTCQEWLVVWDEQFGASASNFDVFGQRVSPAGELVGGALGIGISTGGDYEATVSAAPSANRYLVAWRHDPADDGSEADQRIEGRVLNADGTFFGAAFTVDDPAGQDWGPSVAFDGARWLCVYTNVVGAGDMNVRGRFVEISGAAGNAADADIEADVAARPSVDFGNGAYLVAWEKGPASGPFAVVARTLGPSGNFTAPITAVSQSSNDAGHADVSAGAGKFIVVWQSHSPASWDILGRIASPALGFPAGAFTVAGGFTDQLTPRAAYSAANDEWYAVYADPVTGRQDIYGTRITGAGTVYSPDRLTQDGQFDRRPEIAWGSSNEMLVVYLFKTDDPYKVRARRFSMDYQPPVVPGIPEASPNPNNTGGHTIAWTPSTDAGGSGIANYELERSADGGAAFALVASPAAPTFTEPGIAEGSYLYRVRARDGAGNYSAYSPNSLPVVVDKTAPNAPADLAQYQMDGSTYIPVGGTSSTPTVVLKAAVADGGTVTTRIRLQVELKSVAVAFDGTGLLESAWLPWGTAVVAAVLPDGAYHWQARIVDEVGNAGAFVSFGGNAETEADVVVAAYIPPAPTNLLATPGDGQILLSWTASPGAGTYTVKRSLVPGGPYTVAATGIVSNSYLDAGLANGTRYYYVASAVNASGESPDSNEATAVPVPPLPPAPANLAAVASDAQVALSWNPVPGAASYTLKRSETAGGPYAPIASGLAATTYLDAAVANGTPYYYVVSATNLAGEGPNSAEVSATPMAAPPAAPTNLVAVAGDGAVSLSWTASTGATSYTVKRATTPGGPYAVLASTAAASLTDTDVVNGTWYYYIVVAVNPGGESPPSNEASARPLPGVPAAPTSLAAVAGDAQVTLSWNASPGADSYTVKRGTAPGGPYASIASGVPATSYLDAGLMNGTTYYYVVSAVNLGGESPDSMEASAVPKPPPPSAPTGLTAAPSDARVDLAWNASAGAESYTLKRSETAGGPYAQIASGITATAYADTGITNGTTYYYVAVAVNLGGESGQSNEASARPGVAPPAPTGLAAVPGDTQVTLSWSVASGAESYTVKRSTVSGGPYSTIASGVIAPTYVDTGLANGTRLYYVVRAVNFAGEGPDSAEASATPVPPLPSAPEGLAAVAGDAQVAISWSAVTGADTYTVKRSETAGGPYSPIAPGLVATSYIDAAVTNGTAYYYVVSAVNLAGEGPNSAEVSATPTAVPPAAPTNLVASAGDGAVSLTWSASTGAASYIVKRSETSGGPYAPVASGIAATSYTDTDVMNGTWYFYVVIAVNPGGESPPSNEASARPIPGVPAAPTGLAAVAGDAQVTLTWNSSPGAEGYNVKRSTYPGGPYMVAASGITATSFVDIGLANGTAYYYVVSALNLGGESPNSSEVSATPRPAVPPAPTGLVAVPLDGRVALSWNVSAGAESYAVKRGLSHGGPYDEVASGLTGTFYEDASVVNGTAYFYVVVAVNAGGESNYSNEASGTPGVPPAPTGLVVTPFPGVTYVEWNPLAGATAYNVKRSYSVGGPFITIAQGYTDRIYYDYDMTDGLRWYVVSAVNAFGEGPDSAPVGVRYGLLPPPQNLRASGTDSVILLQWDPVEGADSYTVKRWENDYSYWWNVASGLTSTSYTDSYYLNYGQYYQYVVTASNGFGESADSNVAIDMLWAETQPPGAPANVTAVAGGRQVALSWSEAARAQYYVARRATSPGGPYVDISGPWLKTNYVDTGLGGATYYYVIRAVNNVGSADSAEVSATPTGPPGPPAGLTALGSDAIVYLSWEASPGALGYKVKRSAVSGGPYQTIASGVAEPSFEDVSVSNGTRYFYVVSAWNAYGESANSAQVSALPDRPPPPPAGLAAVGGNGFVALAWTASAGATSYDVGRASVSGGPYTLIFTGLTSTNCVDPDLTNGTRYYYVVAAVNSAGRLGLSDEASAVPNAPPGAPWGLAAAAGDSSVELSWSGVAVATSYKVYRGTASGGPYSPVATVSSTSHVDAPAPNGVTSFYVVTAANGAGESGYSNEASATPTASPPLSASNIRILSYANAIDVEWDPSPSPHVAGYNVYRSTSAEGPWALLNTTGVVLNTKYRDSTAEGGQAYFYRVRAVRSQP
jgi:fibronectin type 3 domain-containing protein